MKIRKIRPIAAAALTLTGLAAAPVAAQAGVDYPDGTWTQASIPSGDATLHADILRPKGATDSQKTPVILSIGPYFNHSGQTGPAGPAENTSYDPVSKSPGPSERFQDFIEGSGLLKKGYSFVMVDLRGYGGSSGCPDWAGPGEQSDVKNAIEWAAKQPWSTGAVGTYGKSYDAMTGLIATDLRPEGLKAVVAQEPVYDDYRYLYGDGQRRENSVATPALYDTIALTPGGLAEDPGYNTNGFTTPDCLATNFASQAGDDDHNSDFWKQRNLITGAKGSDVPLFITQGTTENNTVADGLAQYLENHTGPERGWIGPWEHVRGNETCADGDSSTGCDSSNVGRLKMGRKGWFDEVMRFYDEYLKGIQPSVQDPNFAVQDNTGKWRAEQQWPPADSTQYTTALKGGTYTDEASSSGTGDAGAGVWTISKPLAYDVRLAGSGKASITVSTTQPNANIAIDVYDLDPSGTGPLVTRQGALIRNAGESTIPLDLWSTDWKFAAGHRIGVRITDTNGDWWALATPSGQDVTVEKATVSLPFLRYKRTDTIQGDPGVQLASYLAETETAPADALSAATEFTLPGPEVDAPSSDNGSAAHSGVDATARAVKAASKKARSRRIALRLARRGHMLLASGRAAKGSVLTVKLVRSGRTVATKRVTVGKSGTFRIAFRVRKPGRYTARLSGRSGTTTLLGVSKATRLR